MIKINNKTKIEVEVDNISRNDLNAILSKYNICISDDHMINIWNKLDSSVEQIISSCPDKWDILIHNEIYTSCKVLNVELGMQLRFNRLCTTVLHSEINIYLYLDVVKENMTIRKLYEEGYVVCEDISNYFNS